MYAPRGIVLTDYQGRSIRLTMERRRHILEHPEMLSLEPAIGRTLAHPDCVIQSLSDPAASLYHRYYQSTPVGGKHLCVVVKVLPDDAFVVTAYLTDSVKKGTTLWPAAN
jgi:hypothetical protein